jgi:hypothetical protein
MDFKDSNLNENDFKDDFNDEEDFPAQSPAKKTKPQPTQSKNAQPMTQSNPNGAEGSTLDRYLATLSDKDRKKYLSLMEKNRQLKEELRTISESTEQILQKEKEKKRAKQLEATEDKDPDINEKRRTLYEQQSRIQQLKADIKKKKADLDSTYHTDVIREKQDELNDLKRILDELVVERETLERIRREQERVLKEKEVDVNENFRKDELIEKLREAKTTYKNILDQKNEKEKEVNTLHGQVVAEKMALRELQQKINELKSRKKVEENGNATEAEIESLNQQIKELKAKKQTIIEDAESKMKALERSKKELTREIETLEQTLKEKDKDMRLNSIKLKDLKRLQRHNVLKPIDRAEDSHLGNDDMVKSKVAGTTREDLDNREAKRHSNAEDEFGGKSDKENLGQEHNGGKMENDSAPKKFAY